MHRIIKKQRTNILFKITIYSSLLKFYFTNITKSCEKKTTLCIGCDVYVIFLFINYGLTVKILEIKKATVRQISNAFCMHTITPFYHRKL
jgi:hypothetical protein